MTWVVGAGTLEFGVLIGDIRISYREGDHDREELRFGVRKVHPVCPSIWVGFAGSIVIGFKMVRRLQSLALATTQTSPDRLDPIKLVDAFVRREEARYPRLPAEYRTGGCELLVVGARQQWTELNGKPVFRMALARKIRFPRPWEEGIAITEVPFNHFGSIGSGSEVEQYVDHLENEVRDGKQGLLAFSPATHPEYESALPYIGYLTSVALGSVIEDTPTLGISSQMHVAVIRPDGTAFGTNEGAELAPPSGKGRSVPSFPPIADSLEVLTRLLERFGTSRAGIAIG